MNTKKISKNHKLNCQCGQCKAIRGETKGKNNPHYGFTKYKILTKKFLYKKYIIQKNSIAIIAKKVGCDNMTVYYKLVKYNIPRRTSSESNKGKKRPEHSKKMKLLWSLKPKIFYKCIECGKEITKGAKRCSKCFHKYIIKTKLLKGRKKSKAWRAKISKTMLKNGTTKGKNSPNYINGKPKCIDCGKQLKYYNVKRCWKCYLKFNVGKNHQNHGKSVKTKFFKFKGIWMRSSWELAYAKYCIKNHIHYRYEPKAFEINYTYEGIKKEGTYRPDFYLPETKTYIEIKGWWRGDAKVKYNAFKKQYLNIKLELLMKKELQSMGVL